MSLICVASELMYQSRRAAGWAQQLALAMPAILASGSNDRAVLSLILRVSTAPYDDPSTNRSLYSKKPESPKNAILAVF